MRDVAFALIALSLATQFCANAQSRSAPQDARTSAPFDMTGYWVSIITSNWRMHMVTPTKGDYHGIPLTAAGQKLADTWDPAKDEASSNQCRSYGAGGIMHLPGRLHISWSDANTLRMDTDAGTQTRLFHFGEWKAPTSKPTLQGDSTASWVARRGPGVPPSTEQSRYLKIATTHMALGYVRKNGVPYAETATLTEYYDLIQERDGEQLLVVTTVLQDPMYLDAPYILSAQFKKQKDASGWDPSPCSASW
jgi:hypothetical protein